MLLTTLLSLAKGLLPGRRRIRRLSPPPGKTNDAKPWQNKSTMQEHQ